MHNNAAVIVVMAPPNGVPQGVRGMGGVLRNAAGLLSGMLLG